MQRTQLIEQVGSLIVIALLFVAASFLAHHFQYFLASLVESGGIASVAGFIVLTAIFVVFVIPLDIVFLIPLGAAVWGAVPTALMSIAGWTIGASVAMGIARVFGAPLVKRLIGFARIEAIQNRIPKRNLFWTVVFLRMLVSVDILSYALGLFSDMRWGSYVLATAIGVAPFGFYFAFAGTLPFWYQLIAIVLALGVATTIVMRYRIAREP